MGRKAGVAAEETRAALLGAAAQVFARRGYDGASIAEICSEAGLTSGAIYAHYRSKAEFFVATLGQYMERDLDLLLGGDGGADLVVAALEGREPTEESLVVSAITAARHDPRVAALIVDLVSDREAIVTSLVRDAQRSGTVAGDVPASSLSRLSLMIALGSLLVGALAIEPVPHEEWTTMIQRVAAAFRA